MLLKGTLRIGICQQFLDSTRDDTIPSLPRGEYTVWKWSVIAFNHRLIRPCANRISIDTQPIPDRYRDWLSAEGQRPVGKARFCRPFLTTAHIGKLPKTRRFRWQSAFTNEQNRPQTALKMKKSQQNLVYWQKISNFAALLVWASAMVYCLYKSN